MAHTNGCTATLNSRWSELAQHPTLPIDHPVPCFQFPLTDDLRHVATFHPQIYKTMNPKSQTLAHLRRLRTIAGVGEDGEEG